jgi:hypothetical protein
MEPGGSLPHSQEPATCPYPEPAQSSPCPPSHFLKIHFNIILLSTPGSYKCQLTDILIFDRIGTMSSKIINVKIKLILNISSYNKHIVRDVHSFTFLCYQPSQFSLPPIYLRQKELVRHFRTDNLNILTLHTQSIITFTHKLAHKSFLWHWATITFHAQWHLTGHHKVTAL